MYLIHRQWEEPACTAVPPLPLLDPDLFSLPKVAMRHRGHRYDQTCIYILIIMLCRVLYSVAIYIICCLPFYVLLGVTTFVQILLSNYL